MYICVFAYTYVCIVVCVYAPKAIQMYMCIYILLCQSIKQTNFIKRKYPKQKSNDRQQFFAIKVLFTYEVAMLAFNL